jgi:hypothetical protein
MSPLRDGWLVGWLARNGTIMLLVVHGRQNIHVVQLFGHENRAVSAPSLRLQPATPQTQQLRSPQVAMATHPNTRARTTRRRVPNAHVCMGACIKTRHPSCNVSILSTSARTCNQFTNQPTSQPALVHAGHRHRRCNVSHHGNPPAHGPQAPECNTNYKSRVQGLKTTSVQLIDVEGLDLKKDRTLL